MRVWFVKGIPDDGFIKAKMDQQGQLGYSTRGSINVEWRLRGRVDSGRLILPGPFPSAASPDIIVNEIANPETHGDALRACVDLCAQHDCPVLNDPVKVQATFRDTVSSRLQGIEGLIVPKTIRCAPRQPDEVVEIAQAHGMGERFLMRDVGRHGGETVALIDVSDDTLALHGFAYDGREFYLAPYVEYRSDDGLYHKLRLVNIGEDVLFRHLLVSEHWMVHASARPWMEARQDLLDAEGQLFAGQFDSEIRPIVAPYFAALRQALDLDYFGVDCHIFPDGRMLVFEANANMNVLTNRHTNKASVQPYIDNIVDQIHQLLVRKVQDFESGSTR